jgi:uncharacterized protein
MIKRLLYFQIEPYFEHKNAIVITGMRQVGKTTLMRQIYDSLDQPVLWFDFDNPFEQLYFEDSDYRNIYYRLIEKAGVKDQRLFVFIDEIQNFPPVTKVIKYLIDHYNVKFFVTGSSQFYLRGLFPESLSGRKFLYELKPLSFKELLYFKNIVQKEEVSFQMTSCKELQKSITVIKPLEVYFEEYIKYGGFPEVVTAMGTNDKELIIKNIFTSFFEKDLQILSDSKDIRDIRDMILLLVPRVGSLLEITRIASELGINRPKAYKILEFLQGTYLVKLLPRYSKSISRQIAGGKKVYFADNGLLNYIGKVNQGQLFENTIALQLSEYGRLSYYQDRNKTEIDFIVNENFAFEAKNTGVKADLTKLAIISDKLGIKEYSVISNTYSETEGIISPCIL